MKYEVYFRRPIGLIEKRLEELLPPSEEHPSVIHEAMRYAVFTGGKRFRPVLTLAACEAAGARMEEALLPAAAIELIHCYSLVHDDLPALDNDEVRRGKPTCHKKFGEAMALLAGDSLLTLAFQTLCQVQPAKTALALISEISTAAGTCGMISGQVADLVTKPAELDLPTLDYISIHKTGQLIKASAVCGAIAGGASKDLREHMLRYGENIGLAFQSVDDLLDGDGYLHLLKAGELKQKIRDLIARAKREIRSLGPKAEKLQGLADFLLRRMPRDSHVAVDR